MNTAIRQYKAVQALADRDRTAGQARADAQHWGERSAFLARQQVPERVVLDREPAWQIVLAFAAASVPTIITGFLFLTDSGRALVELIRSAS